MDRELTTGEKYILVEVILAEVFYLLQLGVFLYLVRRWYQDNEAVRVKLKVPKKRDALLRHDWAIPSPSMFDARAGELEEDAGTERMRKDNYFSGHINHFY
ncbi:unnamed protein product [Taenia asiatica]|uniref:Uncharacterized protein n=1 Tax=Taenia asiatica TaxID=60517 RepID=A0A0R3WE79_TAEAS|nr:unnamed protein product [Taenia asiatica]